MRYEDFTVQIVQGRKRGYTVLASCVKGDGKGRFVPPYPPQAPGPDLNEPKAGASPAKIGERLFKSLFPDEVRSLYQRCLDDLEKDTGLRLKLKLDPREPELAAFQAYPWELIREPGTPDSPVLSRQRPLVRFLAIPRSIPAHPKPTCLRILPVAPKPLDMDPLDLETELRNLKTALAGVPGVELAEPATPTLEGLRQALNERECHVLHFLGHGGFNERTSQGYLYFETENRTAAPVTGTALINELSDFPSLRLVVLNACKSARAVGPGHVRPFGGVATTLVLGGLPAVIAMQQWTWDDRAIAFSKAFYISLAAGEPIDTAMADARKAIHRINLDGFEWAIPVLFMRTPEGVLFPAKTIRFGWRRAVPWLLAAAFGLAALTGAWWLRVHSLVDQGRQHYEDQDFAGAAERFRSALVLAPFSAEIHSDLAAAEETENPDDALAHYRKAFELRPDGPLHVYNLGSVLNHHERFQEAYAVLRPAVDRGVESPELLGELGRAALRLGYLKEARHSLEAAVRARPESAPLHRLLGEVLLREGNPREAAGQLETAVNLETNGPGRIEALRLLIEARQALGQQAEACRVLAELQSIDPRAVDAPQLDCKEAS